MYSKLEEPLVKEPAESPEPLVLRPPVGPDAHPNVLVRFRSFLHPPQNRRRVLCICLLSVLLLLFVMLTMLFVWALYVSDGLPSWWPRQRPAHSSPSVCELDVPTLKLHLTETVSRGDDPSQDSFKVTLVSNGQQRGQQQFYTLHLCKDSLTVIRTGHHCYIRPMDAEWKRVCSQGYGSKLKENGASLRKSAGTRLANESWFLHPVWSLLKLVHNPYIQSWCGTLPPFRLESRPPVEGYQIDTTDGMEPDGFLDDDDDSELLSLIDPHPFSEVSQPIGRHYRGARDVGRRTRRSLARSPSVLEENEQRRSLRCRKFAKLLESSPIPSESEDKNVTITQDEVIVCPVDEYGSMN